MQELQSTVEILFFVALLNIFETVTSQEYFLKVIISCNGELKYSKL